MGGGQAGTDIRGGGRKDEQWYRDPAEVVERQCRLEFSKKKAAAIAAPVRHATYTRLLTVSLLCLRTASGARSQRLPCPRFRSMQLDS